MRQHSLEVEEGLSQPVLEQVPFFKEIAAFAVPEILHHTTILECEAGERVCEEGASDQTLVFLLRGRVAIVKGRSILGLSSETGLMFGELAMLRSGTRTATIQAQEKSYFLVVDLRFLEDLDEAKRYAFDATMYRFLANLLAKRLEETTIKLVQAETLVATQPSPPTGSVAPPASAGQPAAPPPQSRPPSAGPTAPTQPSPKVPPVRELRPPPDSES